MEIKSLLQSAIKIKTMITIIYKGGSKPGAKRVISPISIKDGKVRARCHSSNAVKQFMLDKIEIVSADENRTVFWQDVEDEDVNRYETIENVFEAYRERLEKLGWYVFMESGSLSLHRKQKRANKPLKAPSIWLEYTELTWIWVSGLDGEIRKENERKRTRPFTLRANEKNTKTYANLSSAIKELIKWAEELAPINQT